MHKRKTVRIPRRLSTTMTIAELERWFEAEFKKIAERKTAVDQRAAASKSTKPRTQTRDWNNEKP